MCSRVSSASEMNSWSALVLRRRLVVRFFATASYSARRDRVSNSCTTTLSSSGSKGFTR